MSTDTRPTVTSRDALVDAVARGQRRARAYSTDRITSLPGGASEQEKVAWREKWPARLEHEFIDEELDALMPAGAQRQSDERSYDEEHAESKEVVAAAPITIYGASDDLLEVDGAVVDEFDAYGAPTRLRLTCPDGKSLDVTGQYGRPGSPLEWTITVEAVASYPSWPIRFHERPDREGDPAVTIDAPVGTTVELVTA